MNAKKYSKIDKSYYKIKDILFYIIVLLAVFLSIYFFYIKREINSMPLMYFITLILIILYLIFNGLKEKVKINPYIIFSLTPLTLLLYDINISRHYLVEIRSETYNLAIYNFICVLLGFWIMKKISIKTNYKVWGKYCYITPKQNSKMAYRMLFIGMIPSMWACVFGINYLISGNLHMMKNMVSSAPLSSIFNLFLYPAIIFALKSRRRKTVIITGGGVLFSLILNFSKSTILMLCITIIVSFYEKIVKNKKLIKWLLIIMFISIIILYLSFDIYNNIRFEENMKDYFKNLGYIGNINNNMFLPYMYLISPWSNLQYVMDTIKYNTNGIWLIKPILGYLQLDFIFANSYLLEPRFTAFNTFSYISVFYIDFGFIGSGICSIFLGIFMMYTYKLYCKYIESPTVMAIYSLNVYASFMLFFNNHYIQLSYPITIYIIMFLWTKIISNRTINFGG